MRTATIIFVGLMCTRVSLGAEQAVSLVGISQSGFGLRLNQWGSIVDPSVSVRRPVSAFLISSSAQRLMFNSQGYVGTMEHAVDFYGAEYNIGLTVIATVDLEAHYGKDVELHLADRCPQDDSFLASRETAFERFIAVFSCLAYADATHLAVPTEIAAGYNSIFLYSILDGEGTPLETDIDTAFLHKELR